MNGIMSQWWRVGGALGIAFVVLFFVVGFGVQGEPPAYDDPIDEVRAYWADDGDAYLIGDYILALSSLLLLLPFLVALRTLLGRAEGEPQILSLVGFVAGVLLIAVASISSGPWTMLASEPEMFDDAGLRLFMLLDNGLWHAFSYMASILILASSIVMVSTGVLWRWLGALGIVVGIAGLIEPLYVVEPDSGVFEALGFVLFIGFALWLLLTGVGMVVLKEEPLPVVRRET